LRNHLNNKNISCGLTPAQTIHNNNQTETGLIDEDEDDDIKAETETILPKLEPDPDPKEADSGSIKQETDPILGDKMEIDSGNGL
jgi:hypothetical protein